MVGGPAVLLGMAVLLAIGLTIASVKLHVQQDPRVEQVDEALPGANCGGCGYAGCTAYAKAVVAGETPVNACTPGGEEVANRLAEIMGVSFDVSVQTRPVLHCSAEYDQRKGHMPYDGVPTCTAANLVPGVQGCAFGCLGFGDCMESCPFDAIHMHNGLPAFDYDKCTSCGACEKACPRDLIEMIPFTKESMLVVGCANHDPPKVVKQVCEVGCIGCGACTRQSDVFGITRFKADIDYDKYESIEQVRPAFEKCPAAALVVFGEKGKRVPVKEAYARPEYQKDDSEKTATTQPAEQS